MSINQPWSFVLCSLIGLTMAGPTSVYAAKHEVIIEGMKFSPETLEIAVGDTVTWVNKDIFPHTATKTPAEAKQKGFDSKVIKPSGKWKHTFAKAGDHPYICTLHPTMKGRLTVK